MVQMERTADMSRMAVDRPPSGRYGGSVGLVLLVALILVAAGAGAVLVGRANMAPYLLALLALLAMAGVFLLLAMAAGILRLSGGETGNPIIKGVIDSAHDGLLVTDAGGRVAYANAAYLDLTGA